VDLPILDRMGGVHKIIKNYLPTAQTSFPWLSSPLLHRDAHRWLGKPQLLSKRGQGFRPVRGERTDINVCPYKTNTSNLIYLQHSWQKIRRLIDEEKGADAYYKVSWNGRGKVGHQTASGVYFYRLKSANLLLTKEMLLLR